MNFLPKITLKMSLILALFAILGIYPLYFALNRSKAAITLFSPVNPANIKTDIQQIENSNSTVADTLCQELDQNHKQLLQALISAFPLPNKGWETCLEDLTTIKSQDDLLLADDSQIPVTNIDEIGEIESLLYSYNINPKRVTIIPTENSSYFVSAGQGMDDEGKVIHELRINFEKLKEKSPEIQEAIIKHELQHLLQYDSLEFSFITGLLQEHGIKLKELYQNPAFIAYKRHIEYRADLKAAAQDLAIAQAFKQDFENYMQQQPEKAEKQFSSHPSKKDRYQAMSNLISYLEAEKEITIA